MKSLRPGAAPPILKLAELDTPVLAQAGPKAVTLGRLLRAGLPVPDGFVIGTGWFEGFIETGPAASIIRETVENGKRVDLPDVKVLSQRIQAELDNTPLPPLLEPTLRDTLQGFPRVTLWAVRSSAAGEDSAGQSFAGQYDSFLNVRAEELLRQIRSCWVSLFTTRALAYRIQHKVRSRFAMAVLVQAMVPADKAGVLFTADPISGQRDRLVVEAVPGLGDRLVSGEASPERMVLVRSTVRPLRQQNNGQSSAGSTLLDLETTVRLAVLANRAEAVLPGPLDIEWAACEKQFYLLQARPITGLLTSGKSRGRRVWTNMNTGEVFPDVVTPMTWSVLQLFLEPLFHTVFRLVGADLSRHSIVDLVAGRIYFNANVGWAAAKPFPWVSRAIPRLTQALGGAQLAGSPEEILKDMEVPDLGFRWPKFLLSWPRMIPVVLAHSPRRSRAWMKRVKARNDKLVHTEIHSLSTPELARCFGRLVQESFEGWDLLYLVVHAGALLVFERACRRWLKDPDLAMGYRLFGGVGGIPQAEAGLALWNLAKLAHEDPATEQIVRSAPEFLKEESHEKSARDGATRPTDLCWEQLKAALSQHAHGRRFLSAWDQFMAQHGHHCRGELELYTPRWSETPDYLLSVIRAYLEGMASCDPSQKQQRLAEERRQLTERCRLQLGDPIRRWIFSWSLRRAQTAAVTRETWKNEAVRIMALLRRVLRELGSRLHTASILADPDDLFFLQLSELEAVCTGDESLDPRTLVRQRRAEYARHCQFSPPPVVIDHFDAPIEGQAVEPSGPDVLTGIPVSPGFATGPAKVIRRHDDSAQVLPGEILVAPFTDPAWTPYFVPAAAVVTDLGGILSHGSIVAREYGIPAVTNVGSATRTITTGDLLEVDGTLGRVTVLRRHSRS